MSSSLNMSADDYIDYLYDDAEDFASNVDYTAPESYAYLGRILLKIITIYRILSFFSVFLTLLTRSCASELQQKIEL